MAKQKNPKASSKPQIAEAPDRPWYEGAAIPWVLGLTAFFLYATGFSNEMLAMDDHSATVNNPAVTRFKPFDQSHNLGMYAPLTWLGYALAFAWGAGKASAFHVLSALFHALNTALVLRVFRRLPVGGAAAFFTALFFAVHPIQVKAVAWIAAFSTPLYAFFSLLAMNWYLKRSADRPYGVDYWLSVAAFLAACLSKSAAVALPLSLLALDLWRGRPLTLALDKMPYGLIALFFGWKTIALRAEAGHLSEEAAVQAFDLMDRFWMICHSVVFYWYKLLAPFNLSIWYPFVKNESGAWPAAYYAAPVILALAGFGAWRLRRIYPPLSWGLMFFMANIVLALPYATFGSFELRSDRYNYLAACGVFAILAHLPVFLSQKNGAWGARARMGLWLLAALWLALSAIRLRDWKDTVTLVNRAMAAHGDNFGRAYYWRGLEYAKQGKSAEAMADFNSAIERNPGISEAFKYRGAIYGMRRRYEESISDLSVYLKRHPEDAEYFFNRGLSYYNLGRYEEAKADFDYCIANRPDFAPAWQGRANVWREMGEAEKSAADLSRFEELQRLERNKSKR